MTPRLSRILLPLLLAALFAPAGFAQRGEGPLDPAQPQGITPDEIIRRFAAKEKEFKAAREDYTYTQSVTVQTLDGDTVSGEFHQVVDITYDDKHRRLENVTFAPQSTLDQGGISMSPEDFQDIEHLMPFVLTSEEIPDYNIAYAGQQKEDELDTYVFDVAPKSLQKGRRYFEGRIWVDNQDFQIVKTYGKSVPDIRKGQENLFPRFVTYREEVDGHYWFPTYTKADDVLHFKTNDVRIREIIRYDNYKRFGSKSRITYQGQEVQKAPPGTAPPAPNPPPSTPK
jgi:hypothetical protein